MAKSVNWEYYNESYQGSHNQSRQPFSCASSGDVMMGMNDIKADGYELVLQMMMMRKTWVVLKQEIANKNSIEFSMCKDDADVQMRGLNKFRNCYQAICGTVNTDADDVLMR